MKSKEYEKITQITLEWFCFFLQIQMYNVLFSNWYLIYILW